MMLMLVRLSTGPVGAPQQGCQALHAQQQFGRLASRLQVQTGTCAIHAACEMMAGGALLYCWALLAFWVVAEPAADLLMALPAEQTLATGSCWALLLHHHRSGSFHANHDDQSACWNPEDCGFQHRSGGARAQDRSLFAEQDA